MRIEVSQKSLSAAMQQIAPAVSAQNVIPILSGIKLQTGQNGLTLTASTIGMMLQYEIPYDHDRVIVHKPGSIVVPSRYFSDIIRNLPAGMITLEMKDDRMICIRSGKAVYHLSGMDPEEYPQLALMDHCSSRFRFSNGHLKRLIKRVAFAVSSSEARPVLTGVLCEMNGERLRFAATDGVRLSSQTTRDFQAEPFDASTAHVVIPGKHLADFSKLLNDEQAASEISIGERIAAFKTKNVFMQSSLIEGTFPSLDRVIPKSFTTAITADTNVLIRALARVNLLAGGSSTVKLQATSDYSMELSSQTAEIGDVVEEVPVEERDGDPIIVSFNGKYMIDIIHSIECSKVVLSFSGRWDPIMIQPADNPASQYILSPTRTH